MKRDMNLIRRILLEIEASDQVSVPGDDPEAYRRIAYYLLQLQDGELITGIDSTESVGGEMLVLVKTQLRLTWSGHEFVDAARSEELWSEAMEKSRSAVGTISFGMLTELLTHLAKQRLAML